MAGNGYDSIKLYDLMDGKDPAKPLEEVLVLLDELHPGAVDAPFIRQAHADTVRLFNGHYPGYRHSTTWYHNLQHTMEVFLCAARLLHGAAQRGHTLSARLNDLIVISALFHDSGLIQEETDRHGTGAKYTVGHEGRSISFLKTYFEAAKRPAEESQQCSIMIESTCLGIKANELDFDTDQLEFGAHILATADLVAQMADREYLEKLLLLYLEFEEAGLPYDSAHELLEKTHGFYSIMIERMTNDLGNVKRFSRPHFKARHNIDTDLYDDSINANMEYLNIVLDRERGKYLDKLKRGGIVDKIVDYL